MIKILQFVHGLTIGGAETIVKDYACGIDKERFKVYVLCFSKNNTYYEDEVIASGVEFIYVSKKMKFYGKKNIVARIINKIQRFLLIKREIRRISPDIIHIHLSLSDYVKFARPRKDTIIYYTHHNDVNLWKSKRPKDVKNVKWLIKHYQTRIIALSEEMRVQLNELLNINNCMVINNGIDMRSFDSLQDKEKTRRDINLGKDDFVVGHVGRFTAIKNHKFILEIFCSIIAVNKHAKLLLVGDGEERENISDAISRLGIEENVLILENRQDVPDLMNAMDVMIFPSFLEGLPVTLIEAQAVGLRCLVSDTITKDVSYSNLIKFKSIEESPENWASDILNWEEEPVRYENKDEWDIRNVIMKLENAYEDSLDSSEK